MSTSKLTRATAGHRPSGLPVTEAARRVFTVGESDYCWSDVVAFARTTGAWAGLEDEVREGIACLQHEEAAGMRLPPEEVASGGRAFRRERRLLAADDMESWLAERRLTVSQWTDFIRRSALRRRHRNDLETLTATHPSTGDEVARLTWPTGVCNGLLGSIAWELAGRAAVAARTSGGRPPASPEALESAFAGFRAEVLTPLALRAEVGARHLDWIHVESQVLCFADRDAAAEALITIRAEGLTMEEVAGMAGVEVRQSSSFLEDTDSGLQSVLLGAQEGQLLGPLHSEDGYAVVRVLAKCMPSLDQPDVVARAEQAVVSRAVRGEVEERVRWHDLV